MAIGVRGAMVVSGLLCAAIVLPFSYVRVPTRFVLFGASQALTCRGRLQVTMRWGVRGKIRLTSRAR